MNIDEAPIVVLGLGKDGKTRAAVFGHQDAEIAKKVVAMMGLKIGRAETPEAVALTKQLPQAKVFASGKGLLPLIKRDLLEKLLKLVSLVEVPASAPIPAGTVKVVQDVTKPGATLASQQASKPTQSPAPGVKAAATNNGKSAHPPIAARPNDPWSLIVAGSTVLYSVDPKEGWYPCRVKRVSPDGRTLLLQWRDFPKLPLVEARRIAVGLVAKIP
jgi:hypothetical protein